MTLELPDELVAEIAPFSRWLPTIIEISLLGFKTPAAIVAHEVITFLKANPSTEAVKGLHMSEEADERVAWLLEKNREAVLSESEQQEMTEFIALNHVLTLLKASLYKPTEPTA